MICKGIFFGVMVFAFISFSFVVTQSFAQARLTDFEEVDAYINTKMEELGIPGAALVIVQGDQIVHLKAFGVADADGRLLHRRHHSSPVQRQIVYRACHHAIGRRGKIKLDAPVQTYLPWFRVSDVKASEVVTVRQFLNMTSGIPQSIGQEQITNADLSDSAIENNVRALAKIELIAPPGERYEYSNANYVTLGMIIQAVTGQSYESYIREHIFQPLDMQNSFTSKTEAQQDGLVVGTRSGLAYPWPRQPAFLARYAPGGTTHHEHRGSWALSDCTVNDGNYQGVSVLSPAALLNFITPMFKCQALPIFMQWAGKYNSIMMCR